MVTEHVGPAAAGIVRRKRDGQRRADREVCRALRAAAALAIAALAINTQAMAWGPQGHGTVGAIADQLLAGTPAEPKVRALLQPGETLAQAANWADCVKGPRVATPSSRQR